MLINACVLFVLMLIRNMIYLFMLLDDDKYSKYIPLDDNMMNIIRVRH